MSGLISVQWGEDLTDQQDLLKVMAQWMLKDGANWAVEITLDGTDERVDGLLVAMIDLALSPSPALVIMPIDQDGNIRDETVPVVVRMDKIRTVVIP